MTDVTTTQRIRDYPIEAWPVGTRVEVPNGSHVLSAGFKNNVPVVFVATPTDVAEREILSYRFWYVIEDEEHVRPALAEFVGTVCGVLDTGFAGAGPRNAHVFFEVVAFDPAESFLRDVEAQGAMS